MDSETLGVLRQLLELPRLAELNDDAKKMETLSRMTDLLGQMPDMGSDNAGNGEGTDAEAFDPDSLNAIRDLLALPSISAVKDSGEKTNLTVKLLDIFERMPDMDNTDSAAEETNVQAEDTSVKMDKESLDSIKEFLLLPRLSTLTDNDQKADTARKIIDLGKSMQSAMEGNEENTRESVSLTDAQVEGAIKAIRETGGKIDFKYIGMIALFLILMYLISSCFSLVMGLLMSGVAQKTVRDLRREVDHKLSKLPLKYFDMHPHGDILSRVTNDVDTIATTLQQSLTQIITAVIQIVGYIIMMLTISPVLTLIVIATLPLYVASTMFIAKKSQKFFAAQQKELGVLSGHVEEMYTGHKIVKAFGREKNSIEIFEDVNGRLNSAGWKAQFVSGIMFPLMNFISNLGYVFISVIGGIFITRDVLKIGDILAFIQYSRSFTMPIVQTANIANIIQSTIACAERVFEVLDEGEEIPDSQDAKIIENPKGNVRIRAMDFRYKEDVPLIENMNLDVRTGDTIAIVGPTGAGKTTLVNLLMRFYEINGGSITIDGIDIRDIKRSNLRRMFGMVLQDTWLFNGTIRDNIAYGRQNATLDEIKRAAKAAHADHFIRTLPEGYDTILNEEATNISQGQKQLLTIARAILADPAILILDEATSSVDTRTEVLIQKAMSNLMQGRTSFVIAHRLSTIRDAEMILVMNHGTIIEMGNHKQLLEKGGFYADLYNSQFTGANLDNEAV
jgi:ABC-type multidrug transport system fused ATPase/permease subunit